MLGLRDHHCGAAPFSHLSGLIDNAGVYTVPYFIFFPRQNFERFDPLTQFRWRNAESLCVAFVYVHILPVSRLLHNFGLVSDTKTDLMTFVARGNCGFAIEPKCSDSSAGLSSTPCTFALRVSASTVRRFTINRAVRSAARNRSRTSVDGFHGRRA